MISWNKITSLSSLDPKNDKINLSCSISSLAISPSDTSMKSSRESRKRAASGEVVEDRSKVIKLRALGQITSLQLIIGKDSGVETKLTIASVSKSYDSGRWSSICDVARKERRYRLKIFQNTRNRKKDVFFQVNVVTKMTEKETAVSAALQTIQMEDKTPGALYRLVIILSLLLLNLGIFFINLLLSFFVKEMERRYFSQIKMKMILLHIRRIIFCFHFSKLLSVVGDKTMLTFSMKQYQRTEEEKKKMLPTDIDMEVKVARELLKIKVIEYFAVTTRSDAIRVREFMAVQIDGLGRSLPKRGTKGCRGCASGLMKRSSIKITEAIADSRGKGSCCSRKREADDGVESAPHSAGRHSRIPADYRSSILQQPSRSRRSSRFVDSLSRTISLFILPHQYFHDFISIRQE